MDPHNYLVIRGLNVVFIKNKAKIGAKLLHIPQITKCY